MSRYTTGEIAKLCGVTVRTVQYYDSRGILVPSELSEGGRRLYSENDLKRMKVICFLRDLGLPINSISQILSEEDSGSVIMLLLEQQEKELRKDIKDQQEKLDKLESLQHELKSFASVSAESIGDVAYIMTNKEALRKMHVLWLVTGIPFTVLQWASIILWITKGIRWLFLVWIVTGIPYSVWVSKWYFRKVSYICPQCHTIFKPEFKEAFWAKHTPAARRLTCPSCKHHGFCVEVAAQEGVENA